MKLIKLAVHKIKQSIYRLGTVLIRVEYVPVYPTTDRSTKQLKEQLDRANDDALALHSLRRENAMLRNERNKLLIRNSVISLKLKFGY